MFSKRSQNCKNCFGNNFIDDLRQNDRICTDCGTVKESCSDLTSGQTFNESQQNGITEHFQSLGSFVDEKYKLTQVRVNIQHDSKAQNRMKNLSKKLEDIGFRMKICKRISDRASVLMYESLKNKKMKMD